ncbi:monovalent cation/H(+) antiporter subunit G [Tistrella mobilis]|jgi:multicomponent Na+:H+ antiporter subunit G|uniref:monovalent cation/H(+) antiporter subunit G n=1 Tax=Tistrella mobilis TaxID=171437 RepID=UPI0035564D57
MTLVIDLISWALILGGALFVITGAVGLVRMPDFYTRLHPAGMIDTFGAWLMLAGMCVQAGFTLVTAKLIIIGLFLFFTSPTASHIVANAALVSGVKPSGRRLDTPEPSSAGAHRETRP